MERICSKITYVLPFSSGFTLKGKNLLLLVYSQRKEFAPIGLLSKERICSYWFTLRGKNLLLLEQILSFESKPQFGRAVSAREAKRKSQKLFPLIKMMEKHGRVPILLKKKGMITLDNFSLLCVSILTA